MRTDQTPREHTRVVTLNGQRYHVATDDEARQAFGAREWSGELGSAQEVQDEVEFAVPLASFHDGAGFTWQGITDTYDYARGWDASAPGKPATWPRLAVGESFSTVDSRGWLLFAPPYLYVMRGRWVVKYAIEGQSGTWSIIEKHDLEASHTIAGRPALFKGAIYVPRVNTGSGALAKFHELTTIETTPVTEIQTVAITGSPTGGTYTLTWQGNTTAALAYNANSAAVQAALRLLPGLELVTVAESGTTPNYTHTVTMRGAGGPLTAGSPAQMTSTNSLTGGSSPTITHGTTTPGAVDTWNEAGDAALAFRCFTVWKGKLVAAEDTNEIRTCATAPVTVGNWAPSTAGVGHTVGESGSRITDLGTWSRFLVVGKTNGLWSFDEDLQTTNELPDLEHVIDEQNFAGMGYANGWMLLPHLTGLIQWQPGRYRYVGPEQEGVYDGSLTPGWGRVSNMASFGRQTFWVANDGDGVGSLGSFLPPLQDRQPITPHFHQQEEGGRYEDAEIATSQGQVAAWKTPDTLSDDNAVGTITWSAPGNGGSEDGQYATAAAGTSHYLKALNPNPEVPADATILGVSVEVVRKAGA